MSAAAANFSRVCGVGSALPERCVSNAELAAELAERGVETSDEWIVARTGIHQRYIAGRDETSSMLGTRAARAALADARLVAQDVDMIVVATSTPDMVFPSTACLIQDQLGIRGGAAFDVQAVCSGFVYAMSVADAMIRCRNARTVLVIGTETFSRILDWNDRGTCVLFGDGAGAVVMTASEAPGVHASALHADGSQHGILCTAGNVAYGEVTGHPFLHMDGQAVFKLAVGVLDAAGREVCERAGVPLDSVDWLIPHQANVRILHATARRMGIAAERVIITVDRHANTSAASVPLALDAAVRDGRVRRGQRLLLEGVGGGFTWGAVLLDL